MKDFAHSFCNDFQHRLEFGNERGIDKVLDSKLILELRNIIKGRNMFIVFLERVNIETIDVKKVIEYLTISLGRWNTILNLLFKWSQTGWREGFRDKIKTIIYEIIDIEKAAYNLLIDEIEYLDMNKEKYAVSLDEVKVKNIDILLCSEWGETKDGIIVEYIDETREQLGITAYDISDLISENTIYLGSSMSINGDMVNERAGITYNRLLLTKELGIKSIILPESPLLHILSIQLGMKL